MQHRDTSRDNENEEEERGPYIIEPYSSSEGSSESSN